MGCSPISPADHACKETLENAAYAVDLSELDPTYIWPKQLCASGLAFRGKSKNLLSGTSTVSTKQQVTFAIDNDVAELEVHVHNNVWSGWWQSPVAFVNIWQFNTSVARQVWLGGQSCQTL